MKEYKFSGEDPILIFDFLSRLVEEADTNGMSEGQLMVCLPHMLTTKAAQQYRSASNSSRSNGLKYWPVAVQYLLRTTRPRPPFAKRSTTSTTSGRSRPKMKPRSQRALTKPYTDAVTYMKTLRRSGSSLTDSEPKSVPSSVDSDVTNLDMNCRLIELCNSQGTKATRSVLATAHRRLSAQH